MRIFCYLVRTFLHIIIVVDSAPTPSVITVAAVFAVAMLFAAAFFFIEQLLPFPPALAPAGKGGASTPTSAPPPALNAVSPTTPASITIIVGIAIGCSWLVATIIICCPHAGHQ